MLSKQSVYLFSSLNQGPHEELWNQRDQRFFNRISFRTPHKWTQMGGVVKGLGQTALLKVAVKITTHSPNCF